MTSSDIPITYVNGTGKTDFQTLILSGNDVAWYVIDTQSSAGFTYPGKSQVGAKYEVDHVTYMSGPYEANPGSSWTITQVDSNSAAILAEGIISNNVCGYDLLNYCLQIKMHQLIQMT